LANRSALSVERLIPYCAARLSVAAVEHLETARAYLEKAREHLAREDPYDAAEKVWAAVWHATIALMEKYLGSSEPPKGWTRR